MLIHLRQQLRPNQNNPSEPEQVEQRHRGRIGISCCWLIIEVYKSGKDRPMWHRGLKVPHAKGSKTQCDVPSQRYTARLVRELQMWLVNCPSVCPGSQISPSPLLRQECMGCIKQSELCFEIYCWHQHIVILFCGTKCHVILCQSNGLYEFRKNYDSRDRGHVGPNGVLSHD